MFATENLPLFFKSAALKLDEDDHRFAKTTFVLEPFTLALARELGEEIAGHLFNQDDEIRPELTDISFRLPAPQRTQILTVRSVPDATITTRIEPAVITGYHVEKPDPDKARLKLTIEILIGLDDKHHRAFVVDGFGTQRWITFRPVQADLPLNNAIAESVARIAEAGGPGSSVTFGHGDKAVTLTQDDAKRIRANTRAGRRAQARA